MASAAVQVQNFVGKEVNGFEIIKLIGMNLIEFTIKRLGKVLVCVQSSEKNWWAVRRSQAYQGMYISTTSLYRYVLLHNLIDRFLIWIMKNKEIIASKKYNFIR